MVNKPNPIVEKLRNDPVVSEWLENTIQARTRESYLKQLSYFYAWLQDNGSSEIRNLTPEELVDFQYNLIKESQQNVSIFDVKDTKIIARYLMKFCEQGKSKNGKPWRSSYKKRYIAVISAFFNYYLKRAGLSFPGAPRR